MRNLVLWFTALTLCACGGSSSSDVAGSKSDLLTGTYRYVSIHATGGDGTSVTTARAQADGLSKIALSDQLNMTDGVLVGPFIGGELTYAIDGDRTVRVPDEQAFGRVTSDGMLATMAARGGTAQWAVLMRRREGVTLADLAGTWMSIRHGPTGGMSHHYVHRRMQTVTALGVGEMASAERNVDGMINPPSLAVLGDDTYTVRPDGSIRLDVPGWGEFRGDLSEDGNLMVFAYGVDSGFGGIQIMVRMENAGNADVFQGAYERIAWQTHVTTGLPQSSWGPWTPNAGSIAATNSWFGEVGSKESTLDYTFFGDGHFNAVVNPTPPGLDLYGVLAPSGDYALFCGGWADGNPPQLGAMIR